METKKCNCCDGVFPVEDFAFKNKAEGIRINFCSTCRKQKSKESYYKHHNKNLERVKRNKKTSYTFYKKIKESLSCCVCGESESECLDFHHMDSNDKEFVLSNIKHESIKRIINELNKCACLCANCHRKHHAGKLFGSLVKLNITQSYEV
jgi:hypothetical protein